MNRTSLSSSRFIDPAWIKATAGLVPITLEDLEAVEAEAARAAEEEVSGEELLDTLELFFDALRRGASRRGAKIWQVALDLYQRREAAARRAAESAITSIARARSAAEDCTKPELGI